MRVSGQSECDVSPVTTWGPKQSRVSEGPSVMGFPTTVEGGHVSWRPTSRLLSRPTTASPWRPCPPQRKNRVFQVAVARATILRASTWWAHVCVLRPMCLQAPTPMAPAPVGRGMPAVWGEQEVAEGQPATA